MKRSVCTVALFVFCADGAWAQGPRLSASRHVPVPSRFAEKPSASVHDVITGMVLEHLPHQYENKRRWGQTKEVVRGLSIRTQGGRLRIRRKRKRVNHGTWKLYRLQLAEPHRQFHIHVTKIAAPAAGRVRVHASCVASLHAFGRISQWQRGVQLASFSVDSMARVQLAVHCDLGLKLDGHHFPPDVVVDPHITWAQLRLVDFRVSRISNLGGPIARQLGKTLREILEGKLAEQQRQLAAKMNRQIHKRRDRLRFSLHDLTQSKWRDLTAHLPLRGSKVPASLSEALGRGPSRSLQP